MKKTALGRSFSFFRMKTLKMMETPAIGLMGK